MPAFAFSEQPMPATLHKLYADRCGDPAASLYHRQLLAEAQAELPAALAPAERNRRLAALVCPVCGCSLTSG